MTRLTSAMVATVAMVALSLVWFSSIMLVRVIAKNENNQVVREIQERVRAVRTAVADRPRPRVLYLIWTDPLIAAGAASYINDLLGLAGGENVVKERTVPYPRLDWEHVIGRAPQIILVADHRADAGRTASAAPS